MKVSVAVCTYNGEAFIRQQLDSILAQSYPVDELVVCDDGSTDQTREILKAYAQQDGRISLVFNDRNLGYIRNFEQAIGRTRGDWIFLSDQDDLWAPEKVSVYLEIAAKHPETGIIFGNAQLVDKTGLSMGTDLHRLLIGEKTGPGSQVIDADRAHKLLAPGNFITGATMALSRGTYDRVCPFDPEIVHDYWITLVGALLGTDFYYVSSALTSYRKHSGQSVGVSFEPRARGTTQVVVEEPSRLVDRHIIERFRGHKNPLVEGRVDRHRLAVSTHRARRLQRHIRKCGLCKRIHLAFEYWKSGRYNLIHQQKNNWSPKVISSLLWDLSYRRKEGTR